MLSFMPTHINFTSSFTILLTGIRVLQKDLAKPKKLNICAKKTESHHIDTVCNSYSTFFVNFEQVSACCDILSMRY